MILIRVDVNERIATGHMIRCLSIAEALRELGEKVHFVMADAGGANFVLEKGFPYSVLESDWTRLEDELEQMKQLIRETKAEALLIDSYYVTKKYIAELRNVIKAVYIDDFAQESYPADVLIHYPIYAKEEAYRRRYQNEKLLCGCRYAPLKKVFVDIERKKMQECVQRILVMTGGTDYYHVALQVLKNVLQEPAYAEISFDIICGGYNEDYQEIVRLGAARENIYVHQKVNNIEAYMRRADIAISAGGTTLYELCACGTPSICYIIAENQVQNVNAFCEEGLMLYGGDIRSGEYWDKMKKKLDSLIDSYELRKEMSEKMRKVVDGKGAVRIAQELIKLGRE